MLVHLLQQRYFRWCLAILSGVLMVISFPYTGSAFPLAFVAWIPLLLLESTYSNKRSFALMIQAYQTFFIYNLGTTWWIYNADPDGAYMAFICNSLLMAVVFYGFHRIKKRLGNHWTAPILISVWISFEFLHFNWELSWPWLTLGNVFADVPMLVQWYAWTGVFGGTLWVLIINLMLFRMIRKVYIDREKPKSLRPALLQIAAFLFVPMLISLVLYSTYSEAKKPYEVVVIQPNIDPYNEKFGGASDEQQLLAILAAADKTVSDRTQLVIAPETALSPNYAFDEGELHQLTFYHSLMERRAKWHNASFLIGASTRRHFEYPNSRASRIEDGGNDYVEYYNSSVLFKEFRTPEIIHKSKLVLGVEKIPFSNIFPQLEQMSIELGGSSGSLGIQDNGPSVMSSNGTKFAPVVCYESIYGDFLRRQCKQDAGFIAIITNDGWWKDTPGYKQHFAFARLRAIENRKYVVRSANTGKSGVINQRGDVLRETGWWKKTAFRETIHLSDRKTIYQYLGDYIAYFAVIGFMVFLGLSWIQILRKKRT
jgi:apolipoprotein N-acyltransferase